MPQMLTPKHVAEKLGVSTRTVYAWIAEERLPAVRLSERVTRIPDDLLELAIADAIEAARRIPGDPALAPSDRAWALLRANREAIAALAAERHASNPRVFGSVARGEAREGSDIDLLFDFDSDVTLFDMHRLEVALEQLLGVPVDATRLADLKPRLRARVAEQAVPL